MTYAQLNPHAVAKAVGGRVVGPNKVMAHAPGHRGGAPELSIRIDSSAPRGILVHCFSGEDPVEMKDWVLRQCGEPEFAPGEKADRPEPVSYNNLVRAGDAPKKFFDRHLTSKGFSVAATYDYASADGELLFQVLRYEHPTEQKQFLQRRPDGNSGWLSGRLDPIIYRWPEIAARASDPIFIVEGEKDCDRLADLGLLATTAPNGSWPEDLSPLRGRTLYVIPDHDRAGAEKADKVIALVQGIASVRRVELPDLPEKGDVSDWLDAGYTVEHLHALARVAKPIAANQNDKAPLRVTWFDDIEEDAPKVEIIKGMLGEGEFSYIVGMPGSGKSAITTDAACHVAAGREWFGRKIKQGLVVYVAAEREKLTKRRMRAFKKRHGVKDVPLAIVGGRIDMTTNLDGARNLVATIKAAEEKSGQQCVWVIIDTLTRSFGAGDQNASKDMGKYVSACDEIMDSIGAHVTVIHHSGWTGERAKGAIDLDGAVDSSFIVKKDGRRFTLTCDGANDGEEGLICAYAMEGVQVGTDDDGEPTMAPVIVPADADPVGKMVENIISGVNGSVLTALREAIASEGVVPDGPGYPDACIVVKEDRWRARYYDNTRASSTKDISQETLQKRFQRAREALLSANNVVKVGEWFFPN